MNAERVRELLALIQEDPKDPFCQYALALEYATVADKNDQAIELLRDLLKQFPDYLAAYYQLAVLLGKNDLKEEARVIAALGLACAGSRNDNHAIAELEFLLEDLDA